MKNTLLFITMLTTGLSAGLFFAWTVSVIPGLKNVSDQNYIESMQSINKAILNPAFFIVFFGAVFALIGSSYFQYQEKMDAGFWLILAACVLYVLGTIGVTMFGNVPLNDALDLVQLNLLSVEEMKTTRMDYESRWNFFNGIRTFFAVVSFVLLLIFKHS